MANNAVSRRDPIVVTVGFDSGYLAPASVLIKSCLLRHEAGELRFEAMHDGSVTVDHRRLLERMCAEHGAEIHFHRVDDDVVGGLPHIDRFGPIVWSRMFLPELLVDLPRVLYLDSDILVLDRLDPLWDAELGSSPLAAVANVVEPDAREHVARFGVDYPGGFFNSGVLLFDLDRMRREDSSSQLVEAALKHGDDLVWPDQDVLNVVFNGRWHALHPRWNTQNSFWAWRDWAIEVFGVAPLEEAAQEPGIRHFEGPSVAKPWHYLCPMPHRDEYRRILGQTPWVGEPLQDRTISTRLIAQLPPGRQLHVYRRLLDMRAKVRSRLQRRTTPAR
jgi:lipopolysaccharide biosynthesis glycosyltransferase